MLAAGEIHPNGVGGGIRGNCEKISGTASHLPPNASFTAILATGNTRYNDLCT
jgi:hypothetical protein